MRGIRLRKDADTGSARTRRCWLGAASAAHPTDPYRANPCLELLASSSFAGSGRLTQWAMSLQIGIEFLAQGRAGIGVEPQSRSRAVKNRLAWIVGIKVARNNGKGVGLRRRGRKRSRQIHRKRNAIRIVGGDVVHESLDVRRIIQRHIPAVLRPCPKVVDMSHSHARTSD